jgi:hypothetical protein
VRLVTRNLLSTSQEEVVEQWLIGDVEQMQFSFYDGTGWVDYWDSSAEESALPEAIKVEIAFAPRVDENPRYVTPVQLVVPVFVQASTNQTQSTEGEE